MARRRRGFTSWVGRVREGLEGRFSASLPTPARDAVQPRPKPYLEPLEPRVLLSADVGLVPDALLVPPADDFDPRSILEPEIHDDVLVREPSRFKGAAGEVLGLETKPDALPEFPKAASQAKVDAVAGFDAKSTADPESAAEALAERAWRADFAEREAIDAVAVDQVVVIDGRVPEVASLLDALLETIDDAGEENLSASADASDPDAPRAGFEDAAKLDAQTDSQGEEGVDGKTRSKTALEKSSSSRASHAEEFARRLEAQNIHVVVLDVERDGIDQLLEIGRAFQGVGAIHVVSHGAAGRLQLGASSVTTASLRERAGGLAGLRESLEPDGDLLLYGCEVAAGEVGIEFVTTLAALTGVDVAASDDPTGAEHLGGDWDLEFAHGAIETRGIAATDFSTTLIDLGFDVPAPVAATTVSLGFDSTTGEWTLTSTDALVDTNAAMPTEITSFTLAPMEDIVIQGSDQNDTFVLEGIDPGFAGTITFEGAGGVDVLRLEPGERDASTSAFDAFTGTIVFEGGSESDSLEFATGLLGDGVTDRFTGFAGAIRFVGGEGNDRVSLPGVDLSSASLEIEGDDGDDVLVFEDGANLQGSTVDFDGGSGDDTVTFRGANLSGATVGLVGGADDDAYVFETSADTIGTVEIVEGDTPATDGAADRVNYNGSSTRFSSGSVTITDTPGGAANESVVEVFGYADIVVEELISGLRAFAGWAGALDEQGDLGLALAGLRANVDVSVGNSLDLGEAFEQLALAVEAERAAGRGIDQDSLERLFSDFQKVGVSHLDRTLAGNVVGIGDLPSDEDYGLTIQLDDEDAISLGLAADAGTGAFTYVVRLGNGGPRPPITFQREANGTATVRRASGDWRADGFAAGQTILFDGNLKSDADADAVGFEIDSISGNGLVLTLEEADGASLDDFLDPDADDPNSRVVTGIGETAVRVANTILHSPGGDWRTDGFHVGQKIATDLDPGAVYTIESISEDGRVVTVEQTLDPTVGTSSTITADPIVASATTGANPHAVNSLAALVDSINRAIDESDLAGRITARVVDADASGNATGTSRLGFQVSDSEVDELQIQWTDGDLAAIGFGGSVATTATGLSEELGSLGALDVRIGARYAVETFSDETSGAEAITISQAGSTSPLETFGGTAQGTLTFSSGANGRGTLERSDGSWSLTDYVVGGIVEIAGVGLDNAGTYRIVENLGASTLTLERPLVVTRDAATPTDSGTIERSDGSWADEGFVVGHVVRVTGQTPATTIDVTIDALSADGRTISVSGADLMQISGAVDSTPTTIGVAGIEQVDPVTVSFDEATNRVQLDFDYFARRKSDMGIDLGNVAEDQMGLVLGNTAGVDLESRMQSRLSISLGVDPAQTEFSVEVHGLSVSTQVNAPDDPSGVSDPNVSVGTTANIGFLGADVGLSVGPSRVGGTLVLDAALDLGATLGSHDVADTDRLDRASLETERDDESALTQRLASLARDAAIYRVDIPLEVSEGIPLTGSGTFAPDGLSVSTGVVAANAFDGKDALDESAFVGFDQVESFANIDAAGYIRLLGQIRSGLDRVSQSELFQQFDVPFVSGALDAVFDFADAFGDALLYDDGDDGLDRDDDDALVTDLNTALDTAGLADFVQFRVVRVDVDSLMREDVPSIELYAIDDSVTQIRIDSNFLGLTAGSSTTLGADRLDQVLSGAALTSLDSQGRLAADEAATIVVERSLRPPLEESISLTETGTEDNEKIGNDVAKLLDVNNSPTFQTAQELSGILIDLAIDAIGLGGLSYDSTNQFLLFELNLSDDLFEEEFDIDFDLDLDPLGDIRTLGDPRLTVGGEVGFDVTFGIDLSSTPGGQSGIDGTTALTELRGVDELSDVIKTNPSIIARGVPGTTTINDDDTPAAEIVEVDLDRVRMLGNPDLVFESASVPAVSAENLVGSLAYLVAPDGYTIDIDQVGNVSTGDLQQQALRVDRDAVVLVGDEYTVPTVDFSVRLNPANGPRGAFVAVSVAGQTFTAATERSFKSQWLSAIEDAIADAQSEGASNTIRRLSGSWNPFFAVGQVIEIKGSESNDGFYEIEAIALDTITVKQDLVESELTTGTTPTPIPESNVEIEGPGLIRLSDDGGGAAADAAFMQFSAGDVIRVEGSLRNDGSYLIESADAATNTFVLAQVLEDEPASSEIGLFGPGGVPIRLTPPADAQADIDDARIFDIEFDGERYAIFLYSEQSESDNGGDPLAPFTADNRSVADLVQDLSLALSRARLVDGAGDLSTDLTDLRNRVEVGLDGNRLVLTLAPAGRLADEFSLTFASTGSPGGQPAGTITRTANEDGDPAGSWIDDGFQIGDRIQIREAADNDGFYRIVDITSSDPDDATKRDRLAVVRLDSSEAIDDQRQREDVEIESTIASSASKNLMSFVGSTVTRSVNPQVANDEIGSFLDEGFAVDQILVIEGAGADDGSYLITDVSDTTITLADLATPTNPGPGAASLSGDTDVFDAVLSTSFRLTGVNTRAAELGFGSVDGVENATLHDLRIVTSDGEEHLVTLDGATTIEDVRRRIELAAGGSLDASQNVTPDALRVRVSEEGSGIEILERGQLTGSPRLTFEAATGQIVRSEGDWSDDGFTAGATITVSGTNGMNDGDYVIVGVLDADGMASSTEPKTVLVLEGVGTAPTPANLVDQDFVRDATITVEGFSAPDATSDDFRVELMNASPSPIVLGILSPDATGDVNFDGRTDFMDADGVIEGGAIGGASIFDRIFMEDPELTATLRLGPSTSSGIDVLGRIGFVEAELNANGEFEAVGKITLTDPTPGDGPDDGTGTMTNRDLISLRDIVRGLRDIGDFIDLPTFAGAGALEVEAGEQITFSNGTQTGQTTPARGVITRSVGDWSVDGFEVGDRISVRLFGDRDVADFTVLAVEPVSTSDSRLSRLVLEDAFEATYLNPTGGTDPVVAPGGLQIESAIGVLDFALDTLSLGDFASLAPPAGSDPIRLTLFDFGDPFFRETVGANAKLGGEVVLSGLDRLTVTQGSGSDDIQEILEEIDTAAREGRSLRAVVVYTDKDGNDQTLIRKIESYSATDAMRGVVTLEKDLVDDLGDVDTIKTVTFTKPPRAGIETPNLDDLLDFENISIRDIIRALQTASDFLGQFEEFAFLDAKIPVIDTSFNEMLDFADQLAVAVEEIQNDPSGSLQTLEARLEEVLGIDDGTGPGQDPFDIELELVTEDLFGASAGETKMVLRIGLILGDEFAESIGVDFNLGDVGVLAGSAGLAARASGEIRFDLGFDITPTEMRGEPPLVFGPPPDGTTEALGQIERTDGQSWLGDGFAPGQTIKVKGTTNVGGVTNDGRYTIVDIVDGASGAGTILLVEEAVVAESVASGVEVTGSRSISVFDSTALSAQLNAGADDIDFRAAVGPLGIFVNDGMVDVGGNVGPQNEDVFRAGLSFSGPAINGADEDMNGVPDYQRQLLSKILDQISAGDVSDVLSLEVGGGLSASLPVYFPTDSLQQGAVTLDFGLSYDALEQIFTPPEAMIEYFTTDSNGALVQVPNASDLFDLSSLLDLGELSLFDNILLAVDGFDLLLGGVQDVLDGEVFGIELPLVGDALSDGARFIEDFRDDFVEPFRDAVEDAETFVDDQEDPDKNIVSKLLFDLLVDTGLLLVTRDETGAALAEADVFTARREMFVEDPATPLLAGQYRLGQVIQLDGTRSDGSTYFGPDDVAAPGAMIDIATIPTNLLEEKAFLEWDFRLGQQIAQVDSDIALDFGLPALGLEADGALGVSLDWDLELGFGLNFLDGFYFDIGSADELEVNVDVVLPDSLTGRLGFLQLEAENLDSMLGASFVIDIRNGSDVDDERLGFTELGKIELEAGLAATAAVDLELVLKLNDELLTDFASIFPTLMADFTFEWRLGDRAADQYVSLSDLDGDVLSTGLQLVEFTDVELDLGSFISDFATPVLGQIQQVTAPIQPVIDILTSPLPILSDLGPPTTLLDIGRLTGTFNPALIEAIAEIITLVNAIPTDVADLVIPFGSFTIFDRSNNMMSVDPTKADADVGAASRRSSQADDRSFDEKLGGGNDDTTNFARKLANSEGFKFPILSDPTQIFGLLTGQEVVLFGYDMPPFDLDFEFTAFFPVAGPLGVGLTASAAAHIDFAFGFDTAGIQRFLDTGFENPLLIFDGFFVSDNPEDVTGAGPDLNELEFDLGLALSAELNVGFARAGVAGGINAAIDLDLFDPNRDGKIRVGEILENIENEFRFGQPLISPLAVFDVSGELTARAFAFLKINLLLTTLDFEYNITPVVTLVDFEVDFKRAPKLATELDDGTLQLNMGEFAEARLNDDLTDGSEHFRVASESGGLRVTWVGSNPGGEDFNQLYRGSFTRILAQAGEGDDIIDVSGVDQAGIRFELDGGVGDDQLIAGPTTPATSQPPPPLAAAPPNPTNILRGGEGADRIVGSSGDDFIVGGVGSDRILGGGGDDLIFGDEDRVIESDARLRRTSLTLAAGASPTIRRNDRDGDFLVDGFAIDQVIEVTRDSLGQEGLYRIVDVTSTTLTLEGVGTYAPEAGGPVPIAGTLENVEDIEIVALDSEFRSAYKATARGTDAADVVVGGDGNDWILGGGGGDVVFGGDFMRAPTSTTTTALFDQLQTYLAGADPSLADAPSSDGAGNDLIIGDGGEIRLMRDGSFRDVTATDRGLLFGADRLFGSGGNDVLYGGRGDDVMRGGDGVDLVFGETGFDRLFGDAGNDTIFGGRDGDVIDGGADHDDIDGEQGADQIRGGSGDDVLRGRSGADFLFGETGRDTLLGGSDGDVLIGGHGNDDLDGGAGNDFVLGDSGGVNAVPTAPGAGFAIARGILDADGGVLAARFGIDFDVLSFETPLDVSGTDGDDAIRVRSGDDFLDGQGATDRYTIDLKGAENSAEITISDSGLNANNTDRLTVNGTSRDDQFLFRAGLGETPSAFVASINRGTDVERIDYSSLELLVVNGRFGDDHFALDDVRTTSTVNGDGGDDTFQVGQLFRSRRDAASANIAPGDEFQVIETTRGFLSNGVSGSTTLNGGNDNDQFNVYRNVAPLQVNGQDGDDSVEVRAFALVNPEDKLQDETEISGGGGADTIRYAVNAPVAIDGGDGLDSVSVIGTEFADEFVVTRDGVFGAGLNVSFVNVELLRVDGAEGDDSFYIQSTNEDILTQITGGLGSDTFQVAEGVAREVISNDLLGHSGLIVHDVESEDADFQGPDGVGIDVNGISANIGDADEPGVLISQSNGFTRLAEGGFIDWYTIVLTRRPEQDIFVKAVAPTASLEEAARGEFSFGVFSESSDSSANESDGSATTLRFTSQNWDQPQTVFVMAHSYERTDPTPMTSGTPPVVTGNETLDAILVTRDFDLQFDDAALEGERFGVISHSIVEVSAPVPNDTLRGGIADLRVPQRLPDGSIERDADGDIVTRVTLNEDLPSPEDFVGRVFEIVPRAGATTSVGGEGQSLLIKSASSVTGATELVLFGAFDPEDLPNDTPGTESAYIIEFYQSLQLPNVTVQIDDDDAADVVITPQRVDGADTTPTTSDDIRVFERDVTQGGGIVSYGVYDVVLSRDPREAGGVPSDVFVDLSVASPNGEPIQLLLTTVDPTTIVGSPAPGDLRLVFSSDDAAANAWDVPQRVYAVAVDDDAREGIHRGLIEHTVTSAADVDRIVDVASETTDTTDTDGLPTDVTSVLLQNLPVQYRGDVAGVPGDDQIASFADEGRFSVLDFKAALDANTLSDLTLRITRGPGAGETRTITSISDLGVITLDTPWAPEGSANRPDATSRFSISQARVTVVDGMGVREDLGIDRFLVNGSTIVFLSPFGDVEEREVSSVEVDYAFEEGGYDGRVDERLSIEVIDNDTAHVVVLESNGSTDVIEDAAGSPVADSYQVVLSRPPAAGTTVRVAIDPAATTTSRGSLVREGFEQVVVSSPEPGATVDAQGRLVLVFDATNWNVAQTVEVFAITDDRVDGGDTKAFAPRPATLVDIQGPLLVDGAGGQGSLEGLASPVTLPDETNDYVKTGDVQSSTQDSIDVDTQELVDALGLTSPDELARRLAGRAIQITTGPAIDEFRLVREVVVLGAQTRIEIEPSWDRLPATPANPSGDPIAEYRVTTQSPNFFVDEDAQKDVLFVHDEDSPADSRGAMTTLDFAQFPSMRSIYNGSLDPSDPAFITPRRIIGFGMGPDTVIARGDRPGGITYSNFEGLELDLGYNDNTLTIDAIHEKHDDRPTFTRIRAGRGDDVVTIDLDEPEDGAARVDWVSIDLGDGDDELDASESTLALQIVGGDGDDMIIGGQGNDLIFGDFGTPDFEIDLIVDADTRAVDRVPRSLPFVDSARAGEGGDDWIDGQSGNDRLLGGAGNDTIRGGRGQDILFGDYGRVTSQAGLPTTAESISLFRGGADFLDGEEGNDFLFGGADGDVLVGTFRNDLIIGEYARINLSRFSATSITRLAAGDQDLASSAFFGLYDPRFGPFAALPDAPPTAIGADLAARRDVDALESSQRRPTGPYDPPRVVEHEVNPGDTLWTLAERQLGDPYRWPEIHALNQELVADPDVILPGQRIRLPGGVGALAGTPPPPEALAEFRALLDGLEAQNEQERLTDWRFSNPLAVGLGPRDEAGAPDSQSPAEDSETPPADGAEVPEAEGAQHRHADETAPISAAIWGALVGWRSTSGTASRAASGRWLRFDDRAGRFS